MCCELIGTGADSFSPQPGMLVDALLSMLLLTVRNKLVGVFFSQGSLFWWGFAGFFFLGSSLLVGFFHRGGRGLFLWQFLLLVPIFLVSVKFDSWTIFFMQNLLEVFRKAHAWVGDPSSYLVMLDKLQKQLCRSVICPSLATSLEP